MRSRLLLSSLALLFLVASPLLAEDKAPDFNLRTPEGKRLNLKSLLAEGPVLLDFWATWCKPCVKAMPKIQKIYDTYKDRGLTVVGVNEDGPRGQSKVKPFLRARKLTFPIVLDLDSGVAKRMGATAYPTTLLLDTDGSVVYRQAGFIKGQENDIIEAIEGVLKSKPSGAESE
jgi:peroxiredoxin